MKKALGIPPSATTKSTENKSVSAIE